MYLTSNKQTIPKQWQHNPELQDNKGWTVALIYAKKGIIPSKEWYHNKLLRCKYSDFYYTVQNILQFQGIKTPYEWRYIPLDNIEDTQAMQQAEKGIIPDKQYYHDPNIRNIYGETVAMILAYKGKNIPKEWKHKSEIYDHNGYTVAIHLAEKGIIPPKEWEHDRQLKNIEDHTVAYYLYQNNIQVPPEWQDGHYY